MITYHCPKCDTTFRHEDAEAVFCPKCEAKCEIAELEPSVAVVPSGNKSALFLTLSLWCIAIVIGPFLNYIPERLAGLYATAAAMAGCGTLLGMAFSFVEWNKIRWKTILTVLCLILQLCTFHLIPYVFFTQYYSDIHARPFWAIALFFFGLTGFCLFGVSCQRKSLSLIAASATAVSFFYAEPEYWFQSISVDREWSKPINLSPTGKPGRPRVLNGKLLWCGQETAAWNPATGIWERLAGDETLFLCNMPSNGLPGVIPYEQDFEHHRGTPAKPELTLVFPGKNGEQSTVRKYEISMRDLLGPNYNSQTTQQVFLPALPVRMLSDGKLLLNYWLTWKRYERGNGTIHSVWNQNYLSPGTISLDLQNGKYETRPGKTFQYVNLQMANAPDRLCVFYEPDGNDETGPSIRYREYDYAEGKWSEPEDFFHPETSRTLYQSSFGISGERVHCLLGNKLRLRVRAPFALLRLTGYAHPGEILYRHRNLKTGEWSKIRKLSSRIKFMESPAMAMDGNTMAAVWIGKARGEDMPPRDEQHLYYVYTLDGGKTWIGPQEIPHTDSLRIGIPKLYILQNTLHLFLDMYPPGDINHRESYHMTRKLPEAQP